jgi:hypothetical protein
VGQVGDGRLFLHTCLGRTNKGRTEVHRQFAELRERWFLRTYKSDRAREYAHHGFCRRLDTLVQAIDSVFEILPPELDDIPDKEEVVAATMCIQSFVLNAFGCLDNLAWVWVYEKGLKGKHGKSLRPEQVGLGPRFGLIRRSFSNEFRAYLRSRKKWLKHLTSFRDSLAHRIPLYIPPYIVSSENMDEYKRLERELLEAMRRADEETYDRLRSEQKKLGRFRPWMTHSQFEKAPTAVFHWQLLQDYVTIDEFGRTMLEELDRVATAKASWFPGWSRLWIIAAAILSLLGALYWSFAH